MRTMKLNIRFMNAFKCPSVELRSHTTQDKKKRINVIIGDKPRTMVCAQIAKKQGLIKALEVKLYNQGEPLPDSKAKQVNDCIAAVKKLRGLWSVPEGDYQDSGTRGRGWDLVG